MNRVIKMSGTWVAVAFAGALLTGCGGGGSSGSQGGGGGSQTRGQAVGGEGATVVSGGGFDVCGGRRRPD